MAISISDNLSKYLHDKTLDDRRDIWIWLYLEVRYGVGLNPEDCNGADMRNRLAYILSTQDVSRNMLLAEMNHFLVPAEYLKWITDDDRLTCWLARRLEAITGLYWVRDRPRLLGKNLVTGLIDIWNVDLREKTATLNRLHDDWLYLKSFDHQFKWFAGKSESESEQRCQFAWSWLQKNAPSATRGTLPVENYLDLLMLFDKADLSVAERKLYAQSIRQAWNRRQYHENMRGKKQCNTFLSVETISLLDGLANKHGLKRPQVLEFLIQMESERGAYLGTTAGRLKHAFTSPDT